MISKNRCTDQKPLALLEATQHWIAIVAAMVFGLATLAGELTVSSPSIGGGGSSAGGSFSVTGSVGSPSPSSTTSVGGVFTMTGFMSSIAVVETAGLPKLTLKRTSGGYEISWPQADGGGVLQYSTNMVSPVTWFNDTSTIVTNGATKSVIINLNTKQRFYRLGPT